MKAIRVHQPGAPEVMRLEDMSVPTPKASELLVRVQIAGVNYADVGLRAGMMGGPHHVELPFTPGFEVVGTVEALGADVQGFQVGQRVASVLESGGYARYAVARVDRSFVVPDGVDSAVATAMLVQGLTAHGLLHDAVKLQSGEFVLVTAGAGGVGSLALQLARAAGAGMVIGAVGGADKLEVVSKLGAQGVDYSAQDWPRRVLELTEGRGVDAVLDSVGGGIGAAAFNTLAPLGRMVVFGGSSGQMLPFHELMMPLNMKGLSLMGFGGPWLRSGRAQVAAQEIGAMLEAHRLEVLVRRYSLAEASAAHRDIQERRTVGKVVLELNDADE